MHYLQHAAQHQRAIPGHVAGMPAILRDYVAMLGAGKEPGRAQDHFIIFSRGPSGIDKSVQKRLVSEPDQVVRETNTKKFLLRFGRNEPFKEKSHQKDAPKRKTAKGVLENIVKRQIEKPVI